MSTNFAATTVELCGVVGVNVQYESANPINYHQAITDPGSAPRQTIDAKIFVPRERDSTVPAVIFVPGSLGVAPSHLRHAETLLKMGIAALVIDPFGPRAITSTVSNQAQYSFAASATDVCGALRFLSTRSEIDPNHIGAQGHSRGGTAALLAASRRFLNGGFGTDVGLCAVYAAYPWCGHQFVDPDIGTTNIRVIIGERDEWGSPQQAQAYVHATQLRGGRASFVLVPGAHHSFDRDTPIENIADASVAPHAPTVYLSDDGSMIHPVTGESSSSLTDRDLFVYALNAGFGHRGATIGSANGNANVFREDMVGFWSSALQLD